MIKKLLNETRKSLIAGIAFAVAAISTTAIAITISTTFNSGDTLTATALNELKNAIVNLPDFTSDASGNALLVSGNVGIGTSTPTAKLDVNGSMVFSNIVTLTGSTPDVSGSNVFKITSAATITDFLGGVSGQKITLILYPGAKLPLLT